MVQLRGTPKCIPISYITYPFLELRKNIPEDLAAVNEYYRILIEIMRKKLPARIPVENHERHRLAVAALAIKNCFGQEYTSVYLLFKPDTLMRWYRNLKKCKSRYNTTPKKPERPPTSVETVQIILRIAQESGLGYKRISGELKKLGREVAPNTVKSILLKNGIPPTGKRDSLTWKQFLAAHKDVIWACDFFTEEVLTPIGLMTCYVLFFIHLGTRKVHIAWATYRPNAAWVSQQARNFSIMLDEDKKVGCKYLIHDNDTSLRALARVLKPEGIVIKRTAFHSPWQNGYAERFVRTSRQVLDNMIILGRRHLFQVAKKIETHYNSERPNQGLAGNVVPLEYDYPQKPAFLAHVECKVELGGLLRHYHIAACQVSIMHSF